MPEELWMEVYDFVQEAVIETVFKKKKYFTLEVGGGIGMGKTCEPKAFSFQCMTKFTTNKI